MKTPSTARRGFTLLELLIVITVIALLAAALYPVYARYVANARIMKAKNQMRIITVALEQYRADWNAFPPDDTPSTNGSEMIYNYLCRVIQSGEMHYGPYIQYTKDQVADTSGASSGTSDGKKFMSPLGGDYTYGLIIDSDGQKRTYSLVDPGPDKLLGGDMTTNNGFVPSGSEANDNIYNEAKIQQYQK